jgi:hypothetical protein
MIGHASKGIVPMLVAAVLALTMITPAMAARPAPAWSCALSPGDSTVSWRAYPKTTNIEIEWFDATGNVIASTTVVPSAGKPVYSQPTPVGAVEAGFHFFDATGEFGVGGGTCV